MPRGHVGILIFIKPYAMLFTERMPTSQTGYSECLVPSREDILDGIVEK